MHFRLLLLLAASAILRAQTGEAIPEFTQLDSVMTHALQTYNIKGGALAVFKDGRLLYARGYGLADAEQQEPVQPQSIFRWASVSKTVTAAAVMRLVEQKKLDLDTPVFTILDQYTPYNGRLGDSRLPTITVRQLLHHTGGWDRATSPVGDPVVAEGPVKAAQAVGGAFPPSFDTIVRYMLAQRLDFTPGARFAYSNFGYELLRAVIEKLSGQTYQEFVRQSLLDLAGLPGIQQASSHLAGRLPGEVKYYDYPGAPTINSYVSAAREKQPAPYGLFNSDLEMASGAWAGSVVDLAKFASMLEGSRAPALVRAASFNAMIERQPGNTWVDNYNWYGFGLFVQPHEEGVSWDHGGYNPGTQAGFYRFASGIGYAYLFNGASEDGAYPSAYVAQALWNALAAIPELPQRDLFPQYYAPRFAPSGVVNTASMQPGPVAPASLVTIIGTDLGGPDSPLTLWLRDSAGAEHAVTLLNDATDRLQALLPADVPTGDAVLLARREGWPDAEYPVPVNTVSPGLYTLNSSGLLAAALIRVNRAGSEWPWLQLPVWEPVYQLDEEGNLVARPIAFGAPEEELTLVIYGTGVRGRTAAQAVTVYVGDQPLSAFLAAPLDHNAGMDEIRVILPPTLAGAGDVTVRVEVDGAVSNSARLLFR
jgi:N-acyl-D-amino-acid deacylase